MKPSKYLALLAFSPLLCSCLVDDGDVVVDDENAAGTTLVASVESGITRTSVIDGGTEVSGTRLKK